jgi:hypothetical protein
VLAELLGDQGGAAVLAEAIDGGDHGGPDRLGCRLLRALQVGDEQGFGTEIVGEQCGHQVPPARCRAVLLGSEHPVQAASTLLRGCRGVAVAFRSSGHLGD